MSLRTARRDDLPALVQLWNRSALFDPVTPALLEEKIWGDPDFDADCALVDDHLQAFGLGVCRQERGYVKLLAVAPEARRRGLGGELLQALESRLGRESIPPSRGAKGGVSSIRVCESFPNYLQPGIDVRYTQGLLFFEKHGYKRIGETYNLDCDLRGCNLTEPAPGPEGVRRARREDRESVMEFLDRHFPAWRPEVASMFERDPVSLHIAVDGDRVLGFAGYDANNLGTGWFGPMGTDPAARGMGLGRSLLRRCLVDLQAQGLERCTIPWVGPYAFYARHCDARIDRVFWRYEKNVGPGGSSVQTDRDEA